MRELLAKPLKVRSLADEMNDLACHGPDAQISRRRNFACCSFETSVRPFRHLKKHSCRRPQVCFRMASAARGLVKNNVDAG
jgi:hypothetical protein